MADYRCPECRAGKCINCTSMALDDDTDELLPCPCRSLVHPWNR